MSRVRVALAEDVVEQLVALPGPIAKKASELIQKFRQDPDSPGLNFERIRGARDSKLRSLRVDQNYRAIVAAPEQGNVYVLLKIDTHDAAYHWAENARLEVHPDTGGLQVFQANVEAEPTASAPKPAEGLFASVRDRELIRLGVPEALLSTAREIATEDQLLERVERFPKLAWDALAELAEGKSVEQVYAEQDRPSRSVDPQDFAASLDNAETQASFFVADDELELQRVLNQPLERWRIFLHPSQRRLVERSWNGPVRVLGGAGTGKTVVAMHRARWLAEHIARDPGQRVLVTTFTHNLAADIRTNLEKLCSPAQLKRIDVTHIHGFAHDFLRRTGVDYEIVYEGPRTRELWAKAMVMADSRLDLTLPFYKGEWSEIVVAQGIRDEATYLRASRAGRGVRLNRLQRKQVWPVLDAFRAELERRRFKDGDEALLHAAKLIGRADAVVPRYRAVVVDETQDMSGPALTLIRALARSGDNDLFLVGDGHQRIYRRRQSLSRFGVDIRGRGRKLRINYRTTEEIRRFALSKLEGVPIDDLDGGRDAPGPQTSLMRGAAPKIQQFADAEGEADALTAWIRSLVEDGASDASICIAVRTHKALEDYEHRFQERGLTTLRLHRKKADDRREPGVRLATMHRVKGLEFDHMLIAGLNADALPLAAALEADDELSRREAEWRERALLYVAATRARRSLWISASGPPSPLLASGE